MRVAAGRGLGARPPHARARSSTAGADAAPRSRRRAGATSRRSARHERRGEHRTEVLPAAAARGPLVLEAHALVEGLPALARAARQRAVGGPRRLVRALPQRRRRAGRRERLGQVDGGAAAGRPGAADRRADPARRQPRSRPWARARVPRLQGRGADGLPGPVRLAQPACTRCATRSRGRCACTSARSGRDAVAAELDAPARAGAPDARPSSSATLPARAVGRPAPARRDRPRARGARRACCSPTSRSRCSTSRSASRCST